VRVVSASGRGSALRITLTVSLASLASVALSVLSYFAISSACEPICSVPSALILVEPTVWRCIDCVHQGSVLQLLKLERFQKDFLAFLRGSAYFHKSVLKKVFLK